MNASATGPIGVFDSGYGGLTVLAKLLEKLPAYDYLYLGDNARAPYGTRSFDTVYRYTWQAVQWFFRQGCPLVVLACNTASAKALRSIQQQQLPTHAPDRRVLGVIRPTAELLGEYTQTKEVGVMATPGTVASDSYVLEMERFFPEVKVWQQACPLLVPLIENQEHLSEGGHHFARQYAEALMGQSPAIDTVLLACTHYPLVQEVIGHYLPPGVRLLAQGAIVADSLVDYLQRHPEMETRLSRSGGRRFATTETAAEFEAKASLFLGEAVQAERVALD